MPLEVNLTFIRPGAGAGAEKCRYGRFELLPKVSVEKPHGLEPALAPRDVTTQSVFNSTRQRRQKKVVAPTALSCRLPLCRNLVRWYGSTLS
jgi:hypothetical protein